MCVTNSKAATLARQVKKSDPISRFDHSLYTQESLLYPFLDKTFHAKQRGISSSLSPSLFRCPLLIVNVNLADSVSNMSPIGSSSASISVS